MQGKIVALQVGFTWKTCGEIKNKQGVEGCGSWKCVHECQKWKTYVLKKWCFIF
jgi:hypothetical protein